jgi:DNA-binding response OmpR family regulator
MLLACVLTANRTQKPLLELHRDEFQRLRELDQRNLRLVATISHKLRRRLTTILSALEQQVTAGTADLQQQSRHRNAESLLRLVNEMSDFQRIESGEPKMALTAVAAAPSEAADLPGDREQPLIVAVEADPEKALQMNQWLGPAYRIIVVSAGKEALDQTRRTAPDMVIANVLLPGLDGIGLCRRLKHEGLASHIPVILLGSDGSENYQLKALEAGADDYLTKPLNPLLLQARVANLLRSRRKLQEWLRQETVRQPRDLANNHVDAQFLRRTTGIIENQLADFQFDVEKLAGALFISRRQMLRKLKALTGYAPNAFIRTLRLKRAAELLKTSGMTVMEITYAVGFSDLKHFRTLFRDHFGVLPAEYRRAAEVARRV